MSVSKDDVHSGNAEAPIRLGTQRIECSHPDWRLDFTGIFDPGVPVDGPFGARRLTPLCTACGEPVQVGAFQPVTCRCITYGGAEHQRGAMGCDGWEGGSVPRYR